MTFGFSRDDAGKFLDYYYENKIYESDPFAHLDQKGVGKLVKMAAELGRKTRPDIHLGICGEHGGRPDFRRVLPQRGPELCVLQPVPRADCPSGRRAGCREGEARQGVSPEPFPASA